MKKNIYIYSLVSNTINHTYPNNISQVEDDKFSNYKACFASYFDTFVFPKTSSVFLYGYISAVNFEIACRISICGKS